MGFDVRVFASRLEFSRDVFRCGTVDLVFHAFPDLFGGRLGVRAPGCSGATRARLLGKKKVGISRSCSEMLEDVAIPKKSIYSRIFFLSFFTGT